MPLFEAAGLGTQLDGGFLELASADAAGAFVVRCRELRFWDRENTLTPQRGGRDGTRAPTGGVKARPRAGAAAGAAQPGTRRSGAARSDGRR